MSTGGGEERGRRDSWVCAVLPGAAEMFSSINTLRLHIDRSGDFRGHVEPRFQ